MAIQKLPEVSGKQIGKNLNVKVGDEVLTLSGTKEELAPAKEALKLFLEKKTKKNLETLVGLLKPKTTKIKKEKEKQTEETKAEIKATKRAIKETVSKTENSKSFNKEQASEIKDILKDCLKEFFNEQKELEIASAKIPTINKRGEH